MELDRRISEELVEIRDLEGKRTVTGYAAVYGSKSKDLGGFREIIKEGSFATVADGKGEVRAFFNPYAPSPEIRSPVEKAVEICCFSLVLVCTT